MILFLFLKHRLGAFLHSLYKTTHLKVHDEAVMISLDLSKLPIIICMLILLKVHYMNVLLYSDVWRVGINVY